MDVVTAVGLVGAAFAAGAINAIAGGGSLVSFPALLAAGYASKAANVTNSVALWPGYASGSYGYRAELGRQRRRVALLAAPSVLGALAGSAILLATPQQAFDVAVPFLILFGCALLAGQEWLAAMARESRLSARDERHIPASLAAAVFVLAIYGAYFGAGLGILMLAVLAILLPDDIQHSNALKGMLSVLINAVAVGYFILFGPVRWEPAGLMAIGSVVGGYSGVGLARRLSPGWLRAAVTVYGLAVAGVLLARL